VKVYDLIPKIELKRQKPTTFLFYPTTTLKKCRSVFI